jgi:hypothetical protein
MERFFVLVLLRSLESTVFRSPGWMRYVFIIEYFPTKVVTARTRDAMPLEK